MSILAISGTESTLHISKSQVSERFTYDYVELYKEIWKEAVEGNASNHHTENCSSYAYRWRVDLLKAFFIQKVK